MNKFGFTRVAVCSPEVAIGNPAKNAQSIISMLKTIVTADVVVFPELCVTGYTCGDLFRQESLLKASEKSVREIMNSVSSKLVFVGAPIAVGNALYNCAIAINGGVIVGIIPKTNIPNYAEFYESRWFRAAEGTEPQEIMFCDQRVPFGTDLLFTFNELVVHAEICEDVWMQIPPSSFASIAGANLLVNLSASNETVGKNEYRVDLVKNQSGRCVAAYAYASAGPSESTSDVVFGGHCLIAENGNLLVESKRVGDPKDPVAVSGGWNVMADVDIQRLQTERRVLSSFGDAKRLLKTEYRRIEVLLSDVVYQRLLRYVNGRPFVPRNPTTLKNRCAEIFGIQCAGLHKRMETIGWHDVYMGVSGGSDSTHALLVAVKTFKNANQDLKKIHAITMRGFGTTKESAENGDLLVESLGVSHQEIDIRELCLATFRALGHKPFGINLEGLTLEQFEEALKTIPKEKRHDLVFENVQARERTMVLMSKGFVLGTGDLSELALGWCTYNGDHMSMYNVNASIPKTLIKFMIKYVMQVECSYELQDAGLSLDVFAAGPKGSDKVFNTLHNVLGNIYGAVVSPQLLPPSNDGEIEQSTEDTLGPYELHDFFLSCFLRQGFSPEKILYLSKFADFNENHSEELIRRTLRTFINRFFTQQFKRNCVPDGPKVGSISLSPRGDWRMPSDADVTLWLKEIPE